MRPTSLKLTALTNSPGKSAPASISSTTPVSHSSRPRLSACPTEILQPAGLLRLPSVNQLNLRLSREFAIREKWRLTPTVDFFNVTNAQTTIGQVTTFGSSYLFPFSSINPF